MPEKDPLVYVMHIRNCCERILSYDSEAGSAWSSQTTLPHIRQALVDGFPQMWHWPMSVMWL